MTNFRDLLLSLALAYQKDEFDSRSISGMFMDSMIKQGKLDPLLLKKLSIKMISNDLGRLWKMGFLKRTLVKRRCETSQGKKCFRGREYKYSISKHGWSYLRYLNEKTDWLQRHLEEKYWLADMLIRRYLDSNVPEERREYEWNSWELAKLTQLSKRKGYRRFPMRKDYIEYRAEMNEKDDLVRKLNKELEGELEEKEKLVKQVEKYRADAEKNRNLCLTSMRIAEQCKREAERLQSENKVLVKKLLETSDLLKKVLARGKELEA